MSENKFKKIMEILEKVIKINATKGTKIVADLRSNALCIYDTNNHCNELINYKGITGTIYFDEYWDSDFNDIVAEMNKALDEYLV